MQAQRAQQSDNLTSSPSTPIKPNPTPPSAPPKTEPTTPKADEPFQKFYSTFESLFSKLSAPLAFAGLPLNPDEPPPPSTPTKPPHTNQPKDRPAPPSRTSSRRTLEASQRASADPDYSALFSRAALRAVADEHGPSSVGAAESFYVVPTSGHTLAYADILARQHRERNHDRRRSSRDGGGQDNCEENNEDGEEFEADEDLFVDARENPFPPSPEITRKRGYQKQPQRGNTKTMEELHLENQAMKALLDQTSRRLLEFEMSAQTSSVALQRSIRQLSNAQSSLSADGGVGGLGGLGVDSKGKGINQELEKKVKGMEEEVLNRVKEMKKVERENEKLRGVVGRYRERFETIKAGARARREEGGRKEEG